MGTGLGESGVDSNSDVFWAFTRIFRRLDLMSINLRMGMQVHYRRTFDMLRARE